MRPDGKVRCMSARWGVGYVSGGFHRTLLNLHICVYRKRPTLFPDHINKHESRYVYKYRTFSLHCPIPKHGFLKRNLMYVCLW